uniref:Uncharacterized protein n=1 Tax=Rhipicephalus zambeziensis TaxID=60191 RepID=A0A224YFE0_9ACAR
MLINFHHHDSLQESSDKEKKSSFAPLCRNHAVKPKPRKGVAHQCCHRLCEGLTLEIRSAYLRKKAAQSYPMLLVSPRRWQHLPVSMHCHYSTKFQVEGRKLGLCE